MACGLLLDYCNTESFQILSLGFSILDEARTRSLAHDNLSSADPSEAHVIRQRENILPSLFWQLPGRGIGSISARPHPQIEKLHSNFGNKFSLLRLFLLPFQPSPTLYESSPMRNKFHLILALACLLCFTTNLAAQDADQPDKPKAAKKAKKAKGKKSPLAKSFGDAELTKAQKSQLTELVSANKEEMTTIRKSTSELINKETAKSIRMSVRKSVKDGKTQADAKKAAWDEAGLSAEAQTKLTALGKQRAKIEEGIVNKIVATFSDEQKEAMKAGLKKAKKGAGKGAKKKKGKDNKKMEESEQT